MIIVALFMVIMLAMLTMLNMLNMLTMLNRLNMLTMLIMQFFMVIMVSYQIRLILSWTKVNLFPQSSPLTSHICTFSWKYL